MIEVRYVEPVMSAKVRQRNAGDAAGASVNEKILRECHTLYNDPDTGTNVVCKTPNHVSDVYVRGFSP